VAGTRPRVGLRRGGPRHRRAGRTWTVALLLTLGMVAPGLYGVTGAVFSGTTSNSSNTLTAASTFPRCYSDAVTADGPVGYWRLDETSGTTATDSAGSRNGTYTNGVTLGQTGAMSAAANKAASFDGTDDRVVTPYAAALNPSQFTVEAWAKPSSGGAYRTLVAETYEIGGVYRGMGMYVSPSNTWRAYLNNGAGQTVLNGPTVRFGEWTHVAWSYDGTTLKMYINGTLVASAAGSFSANTSAPLSLGMWSSDNSTWYDPFSGLIDDVSLYSSALTAAKIRTHYNAGRCYSDEVLADSPAGYWRLGEPAHTATAFDAVGNANPGAYRGDLALAQPGGLDGDTNTSASFDGLDDDVKIPDTASQRPTRLSVEAWLKPASGNMRSGAVFKASDASWTDGWGMYYYSNTSTINFFINNSTTGAVSVPVTFNAWVHIVATYDGATIKLYKNGLLAASLAYSTAINSSTQPVRIGSAQGNGGATYNWIGGIDEVAIYPAALSQTRVQAHYLRGRSYQNTIVDSAPVSFWRLGEASGTSAADSIGGNGGTYGGSPTLGQAGALAGDSDSSAGFNSTSQNISVPDSASLRPTQISVEAWIKPDSATIADFDSPVMKTSNDNWTDGYGLFYRSSGTVIGFFVSSWGGGGTTAAISLDQWTHVVGTYDGATISLYLNGVLAASKSFLSGIPHSTNALYIGSGTTGSGSAGPAGYFWGGGIDDVAIYNKALTATEIQLHYDSGRQ
jgi:Concanavalin A-like lectin/glucanases superfamily